MKKLMIVALYLSLFWACSQENAENAAGNFDGQLALTFSGDTVDVNPVGQSIDVYDMLLAKAGSEVRPLHFEVGESILLQDIEEGERVIFAMSNADVGYAYLQSTGGSNSIVLPYMYFQAGNDPRDIYAGVAVTDGETGNVNLKMHRLESGVQFNFLANNITIYDVELIGDEYNLPELEGYTLDGEKSGGYSYYINPDYGMAYIIPFKGRLQGTVRIWDENASVERTFRFESTKELQCGQKIMLDIELPEISLSRSTGSEMARVVRETVENF